MQQVYTLRIPVTVEAVEITVSSVRWAAAWCRGTIIGDADRILGIGVPTLYGVKRAPLGSFLVKKTAGDFTFLDPHDFRHKYKLIE